MKNFIINFPSKGMCTLWNYEFIGQFSDGYWENSPASSRYGKGQSWWTVEASYTKPTNVPDWYFPCPYSLNSFMTYLTREIKQGDVWPYRLVAFYYAGEIGLKTDRSTLDIMVCIARGGYHPYGKSIAGFLKKLDSKEKKFYTFLEQLDMKVAWRRLRQVVKQMNDIVSNR